MLGCVRGYDKFIRKILDVGSYVPGREHEFSGGSQTKPNGSEQESSRHISCPLPHDNQWARSCSRMSDVAASLLLRHVPDVANILWGVIGAVLLRPHC